jgi:hypothetical protein
VSAQPAFTGVNRRGCKTGAIFDKTYSAHRIIWLWMTGSWPDPEVDHNNQNPKDNRWDNLYEADKKYQAHNRPMQRNNTSGYTGVSKNGNQWWIRYSDNEGRGQYTFFPTKKEAIAAKKATERELGYHINHGRKKVKKQPAAWARVDGLVEIVNLW